MNTITSLETLNFNNFSDNKYEEIRKLALDVNTEINKVLSRFLYNDKERWFYEVHNLKLNELYKYCIDNNIDENIFYDFCDYQYSLMEQHLQELGINFKDIISEVKEQKYTFIFKLAEKYTEIDYIDTNLYDIRFNFIDYLYDNFITYEFEFDDNYNILLDINEKSNIDLIQLNLNNLKNNLYERFTKHFIPCKKTIDYIIDFKLKQIDKFKDFINNR